MARDRFPDFAFFEGKPCAYRMPDGTPHSSGSRFHPTMTCEDVRERCLGVDKNDERFHLAAEEVLFCKQCGSRELNIGQREYETYARCPKCLWELSIQS